MNNFARLLSVFLCVFVTGCEEPTMADKEKSLVDLFLKNENSCIEQLFSWVIKDSTTFKYDFPHLQQEGIIQITESDDKLIRQYDICYTLDNNRKLYGRNVVQYRTDKGIQAFIGSLRSLKYLNSEYNCDCNGISIIKIPRQDSPLYLLLSLECEYPPYSYATVTPFERRGENLVYVENIFPNDVSFEFDGTYNPKETFDSIFLFKETDSLFIQNKNIYNQLIDNNYTHYQWNGEKFTIVNP